MQDCTTQELNGNANPPTSSFSLQVNICMFMGCPEKMQVIHFKLAKPVKWLFHKKLFNSLISWKRNWDLKSDTGPKFWYLDIWYTFLGQRYKEDTKISFFHIILAYSLTPPIQIPGTYSYYSLQISLSKETNGTVIVSAIRVTIILHVLYFC